MKELFMSNLKFKIISVLLALLVWSYVHSASPSMFFNSFATRERKVELQVQYMNLNPDLVLVENTEMVNLVLREGLRTLGTNQILRAYVDLSDIEEPGNYFLELKIEIPRWMTLMNQNPKYAEARIEEVKR